MTQNVFGAVFRVEKNLREKWTVQTYQQTEPVSRANVGLARPRAGFTIFLERDPIKETMMSAREIMQTLGGVGTVAVLALAAILAIFWLVFPFMVHNQLHRIEKQLKKANDTLESTIYYLSRIEENTKPCTDRGQKAGTETKENRP